MVGQESRDGHYDYNPSANYYRSSSCTTVYRYDVSASTGTADSSAASVTPMLT